MGGHGLPKVSPELAMPDPSRPCGRATPDTAVSGVAHPQGRRPAAVFYPFEHPMPYAHDERMKDMAVLFESSGDNKNKIDLNPHLDSLYASADMKNG
jgi:hypothetical protein